MNFLDWKNEKTDYKKEILAGLIVFFSISYILGINPHMMQDAGMSLEGAFFATAIGSAIACFISFFLSKYPLAFTTGMGLNSIFVYNIVIKFNISWKAALAAVLLSSIIFIIISLSNLREKFIEVIPINLKIAICIGLGFFIAAVGLKSAGIIVSNPTNAFLSFSNLFSPINLMIIFGVVLIIFLHVKKVPASIGIGLIGTVVIGLILSFFIGDYTLLPKIPNTIVTTNFDTSTFGAFIEGFGELFTLPLVSLVIILFTLIFVWFFDTIGLLISIATLTDSVDEEGNPKEANETLLANGLAAVVGSIIGTCTIIPTVESIIGIEVGGKTRLTTLIVGICFLVSIIFAPLILSIFTSAVTSPALIVVGMLMLSSISNLKLDSFAEVAPAFMTIMMIFLTFSIATGIIFGFLTYVVILIAQGKIHQLDRLTIVLTLIFIFFLFFGL